jgi:hypothetical protein
MMVLLCPHAEIVKTALKKITRPLISSLKVATIHNKKLPWTKGVIITERGSL